MNDMKYNDIIRNLILAAGCKQKIEKNTCAAQHSFQVSDQANLANEAQEAEFQLYKCQIVLKNIAVTVNVCSTIMFVCIFFQWHYIS